MIPTTAFAATQNLIRHAELAQYRIAVVDGPQNASLNEIRAFRGNFDSSYAALYHPWIEILDPNGPPAPGAPPPSSCCRRPASSPASTRAATSRAGSARRRPTRSSTGSRGSRPTSTTAASRCSTPRTSTRCASSRAAETASGARARSARIPEWLYVNVRRLFIFLEHSIDKSTQWAVFEPNGEALWRNIPRTVEDFLDVQWRNGALLGATPEEAYFVRCDRTTMTQNDLDNGRLICLIGVAPVKPAEFVIFRIGQLTADALG